MSTQDTRTPNFDEFIGLTYGQMLDKLAAEEGDKEFLIFGDERVTFAQLRDRVLRVAGGLKKLGLKKGDRVGVLLPNCLEYFYVQQAVLYLGGTFIPPFHPLPQVRDHLHDEARGRAFHVLRG